MFRTALARSSPSVLSRSIGAAPLRLASTSTPSGSDKASQEAASSKVVEEGSAIISAAQQHKQSGLTHAAPPLDVAEADIISGAPQELRLRQVRIYKPTKTTMQSGKGGMNHWRIDWDTLQGSGRWLNPLMGWASSADYMQGTSLKFRTEEEAVHFCERQGWDFIVDKPNVQPFVPKSYADNYTHVPGKLRLHRTK